MDELEVIVGPSGFLGAAIKLNTLAGTPLRFDLECACATSEYQLVLSLSLVLLWLLVPNIEPKHCFSLSSPPTCNISEFVW